MYISMSGTCLYLMRVCYIDVLYTSIGEVIVFKTGKIASYMSIFKYKNLLSLINLVLIYDIY